MADLITYPENGITYDADDASGYLATRQSGVYSADEDFAVTAAGELSVAVSAGQAWVRPARFKGRSIIMEQPETLTLTAADPVRTRIDRIVLRYDAAARKTSLLVLEGTPDSASPAPPEISRTALVYDLGLATITRKAGSESITAADITDTRTDEAVCGVMRDGVTGIPTAELQAQAAALLENLRQSIARVDAQGFYSKAEVDALLKNLNVCPFEIGDILQTTSSTSPAARFGGTWEEIAPDRVLMGASSTHAAGTTVNAGLPNITGFLPAPKTDNYYYASWPISGAFAWSGVYADGKTDANQTSAEFENSTDARGYFGRADFNAARSSAIYGRSKTVQPAAYYVHYWQRKA